MLRVMSYNVHGLHGDLAALASVVHEAAPDVVIVQEAPRRFRWRTRCAALAHRLGMVHAAGGLPSLGNVVFTTYRVAVQEAWHLRLPFTPGQRMRGAVFARCAVGRTPFVVAGAHLATHAAERPGQAAVLKKAMVALDAPVILGADLNETGGGAAWRMLADGLVDAAEATAQMDLPTYPAAGRRIDAIFVDRGFEVRDYAVPGSEAARRASDHLPVVADLTLR